MKELKIGERVTITLEAVEQDGTCDGCFFERCGCIVGEQLLCCHTERSDHKNKSLKKLRSKAYEWIIINYRNEN